MNIELSLLGTRRLHLSAQMHEGGYMGAHADTWTLTNIPGIHAGDRTRLRATCYLDDCPPDCGGFTVRIHHFSLGVGSNNCTCVFQAPVCFGPVETHGKAGTVVLWHQMTVHIAGVNHSTDRIRMAMIHDFKKIHASVSDAQLMDFENEDIWRDWSLVFRECCMKAVDSNGRGDWAPHRPRL
jgi:hypothetical protein